jgi:xanthine dehydrogenase small subunit
LVQFLLNDKLITTDQPPGMVMVDLIRYHEHLKGTKIGCREGDCGACTILTGELKEGRLFYNSVTSCLMPLANAQGKHIVTIEGINIKGLNAIQQAFSDEGATQCGFCTPGFVMSLAGFCLKSTSGNKKGVEETCATQNAIAAVDGNICRCTGYKSIERATAKVTALVQENQDEDVIAFLIGRAVLPSYFAGVSQRLESIHHSSMLADEQVSQRDLPVNVSLDGPAFLGGGTDLYVQQPEVLLTKTDHFMFDRAELKGISKLGNSCVIGAAATVADILDSSVIRQYFPEIAKFIRLVSSTPIRNMATIAGNFVNASPIGDLTIFFLALDAQLILCDGDSARQLPLQDLYRGYKILDKKPSEYIKQIRFSLPEKNTLFNFEKVSKRTHLDIASVNTALFITVEDSIIIKARLSAGGVGPIPFLLKGASSYMQGKELSSSTILRTIEHALSEVSPISDVRGTATYKRLLLKQLIKAHFMTMFPYLEKEELIYV